jgi:hypothetical protein
VSTWSSFFGVWDVLQREPESFAGVGYFFSADDPYCGVDLDACLDEHGQPQPWAAEIIQRFQDTYRALSMSNRGVHVICRAELAGKGRNFYVKDAPPDASGKRAQVGIFDKGRFFALTGKVCAPAVLKISGHQGTIDWLLKSLDGPKEIQSVDSNRARGGLSDSEIIQLARNASNGAKFARLWAGDWQTAYDSQSEADLALCCILCFWCGPDAARIETLFRQSGLVRDKWIERQGYRDSTIAEAISHTCEYYGQHPRPTETTNFTVERATSPRSNVPQIWVGARQLHAISEEVLAALGVANVPPQLFARNGRMVAIRRDERGGSVLAEVSEAALRGRMARAAFYYKLDKAKKQIECPPPLDVVRDILAQSPHEWKFPPIESIAGAPFLRDDGTICTEPGYDPATTIYYSPAPALKLAPIPGTPTSEDVARALTLVDSAIGDFPFIDAASRANAIASLLTPIVRPAIKGPTPMALYDAPQAGTGKSLLAEVVSMIVTGREAETFSAPTDPEEWRKKITTVLSDGARVVVIDNVTGRLEADALCQALTSPSISDRAFRTFEVISFPVRCTWIATGNNIQLGGDMARRCYWVRLDAKHSQPFRRTQFRHADLRGWVTEKRGELIGALLTIARYWYAQGRPAAVGLKPLGSFEGWCRTIGGILAAAGVEGFLANAESMFACADLDASQWEVFLSALEKVYGRQPFRVFDLVELLKEDAEDSRNLREVLPESLAEAVDRTGGFFQRRLGKTFSDRAGRRFGHSQIFLERAGEDRKAKVGFWRIGGISNPAERV